MSFDKHRDEKEVYAVDFAARLAGGETLTGSPTVRVYKLPLGNDVSSEFGSPAGSIVGTQVQFTLGERSGKGQEDAEYSVYVRTDTSDEETLVETVDLRVRET